MENTFAFLLLCCLCQQFKLMILCYIISNDNLSLLSRIFKYKLALVGIISIIIKNNYCISRFKQISGHSKLAYARQRILVSIFQYNKRFLITRLSLLVIVLSVSSWVILIVCCVNTLALVHGILHSETREHSFVVSAIDCPARRQVFTDELRELLMS